MFIRDSKRSKIQQRVQTTLSGKTWDSKRLETKQSVQKEISDNSETESVLRRSCQYNRSLSG
ncbi:hypothetical protein DPMN_009052 [Dreissena polymorpha]|uniref:Uncharacterized protein n=1 Tax=Dreissena polymorpha TaxID=45954 RepID=A0A9D4N0J2_DREPO|nr:hypothetical protein DPMN_009052 [Dreissena polymorpha]